VICYLRFENSSHQWVYADCSDHCTKLQEA